MARAKHVLSKAEGTQRRQGWEKQEKNLSLRAWRLGAMNFLEVVLFNICKVGIQHKVSGFRQPGPKTA
jgi:hypothetical protein